MIDPNKPSQEKLLYEELARELVTPERYGKIAVEPEVHLPEIARVYELPPFRNGQSGVGM